MKIHVGYELIYDFPQSTPMIMVLGTPFHPGVRRHRARLPDHQPFRAHLPLPRRLRQLVQPHRRTCRPNALVGRWRRYGPMDFASWFEAYLGGRWYTFDARNNMPRIGRVLIAQGRDAADVPITHTFGPNTLVSFKVWTDEVR